MEYRHELKFVVSQLELEKIRYRLEPLMDYDSHQKGEYYTIRSLYFDDIFDSCLAENMAGTDDRSKYRIRLYNGSTAEIHLEKKTKYRGMTRKYSQDISIEECQSYLAGDTPRDSGELSGELNALSLAKGMRPKCIVEYDRCAFVEELGNVRITFDMNVRGTNIPETFFDFSEDMLANALPQGMHILEVKYDEFLPEYILQAIDTNNLRRESVSKYALVRQLAEREAI